MDAPYCELDQCYEVALKVARDAGKVIKEAMKQKKNIKAKTSRTDLVTETDVAVEKLVVHFLSTEFPSHKFIGEESTVAQSEFTDEPTWIIDPIDGTMNFVHTFPFCCISIGLYVGKEAQLGIVYNPSLDQMFTARKGLGAFLNNEPIRVSGQTDLREALVFLEMGTRHDPQKRDIVNKNLCNIVKDAHGIRSMGSAALNMCYVAMGAGDAYYEMGIHAWDMAAGELIVREAGGVSCDVEGGKFDILGRRVVVASSQDIANAVVERIDVFEEERD